MSAVLSFKQVSRGFQPSVVDGPAEFHACAPERAFGDDLRNRTGFNRTPLGKRMPPVQVCISRSSACESALEAYLVMIDLLPVAPPELGELLDQLYACSQHGTASDCDRSPAGLAEVVRRLMPIAATLRSDLDLYSACEAASSSHWSEFEPAILEASSLLQAISDSLAATQRMPANLLS